MRLMLAPIAIAMVLAGCGGVHDVAVPPAGAEDAYRLDYVVTLPAGGVARLQQRHAATCRGLGAARCRIRLRQLMQGGIDGGSLSLDLARGATPAAIADLLGAVAQAGGRQQSAEMTVQHASGADAAIVPITLRYSGTRGFSAQVAEAIAAFLPTLAASVGTMVAIFPALAPWLVVFGALLFAGEAMLRRRREKRR